jgi:hypothetical protein
MFALKFLYCPASDREAQSLRHRVDALHMIERARFHHRETVDDVYFARIVMPGDHHRGERMIKSEIDSDTPARIIANLGVRTIRLEPPDDGRQQLEREDRAGAELRDAL